MWMQRCQNARLPGCRAGDARRNRKRCGEQTRYYSWLALHWLHATNAHTHTHSNNNNTHANLYENQTHIHGLQGKHMQRKMGKQQAFQLEENMPNKTRLMHLGPIEQKYEEASLRTAKSIKQISI